ncbi:unnamed protein product [Brassicogethes aeneus]|uniref:Uncharacterized protein n=1 Tax=Brassicogethes aeneus TaxID=1431903 RepID=A0A9P0B6C6_BRAAE|nr:unnamed protein product [Brassicogethes aeneus]
MAFLAVFLIPLMVNYVVSQTETTVDPCNGIICTTPFCTKDQVVVPFGCCTSCEDVATLTPSILEDPCLLATCEPPSCGPNQIDVSTPDSCCPICQDLPIDLPLTTIIPTMTDDPCMNMTCTLSICDDNQILVFGGPDSCCPVCQDCDEFCEENNICPFSRRTECRWSERKEKIGVCGCCHKCVSNYPWDKNNKFGKRNRNHKQF